MPKTNPATARKALKEMYRQKGPVLHYLDENHVESGMIIRHLAASGICGEQPECVTLYCRRTFAQSTYFADVTVLPGV